ncbi:MAG TPA: hypothetical protein VFR58_17510 [Flavisolibacter sp.]|nr:hypothetical protein [Flavisolibacter sp.]
MKFLFCCSAAALILTACGSGSGAKTTTGTTINSTSSPVIAQPAQPAPSQPSAIPAAQPATGAVALNPQHGQPGHRCDLAVGAPLNSTAASQPVAAPVVNQPGISVSQQPSPANNAMQVRLNPPHGEPGHDCSVQVGQPLKN